MENTHHEQVVLIIDDEQTNLNVIIDTLASVGLTHITARNGEMGIKRAAYAKPDLILLDVMMPGIDGFETCRRLKADPATQEIPVLFITALQDVNSKVKGFEVGGVDYITKPIEQKEALARIKTHLALRHAQQELQISNDQLQRSEKYLREANVTKDTFFSILAHDLRSPFNGLLGLADIIIESFDTLSREEILDCSQGIKRSAEAVYNLLENLLNWSRFQRNVMDFQPKEILFFPFVTNICMLYQADAERKAELIEAKKKREVMLIAANAKLEAAKIEAQATLVRAKAEAEAKKQIIEILSLDGFIQLESMQTLRNLQNGNHLIILDSKSTSPLPFLNLNQSQNK
jgi:DNA-binding response OmpR family regulator